MCTRPFELTKINSSARRCVFSREWVKLTQDELFSIFKSKLILLECADCWILETACALFIIILHEHINGIDFYIISTLFRISAYFVQAFKSYELYDRIFLFTELVTHSNGLNSGKLPNIKRVERNHSRYFLKCYTFNV